MLKPPYGRLKKRRGDFSAHMLPNEHGVSKRSSESDFLTFFTYILI